jgi:hypothetical protein
MTDLSPAAQAVLTASLCVSSSGSAPLRHRQCVAAALRAAADAAPIPSLHEEDAFHAGWWKALEQIRAIATELETTND